MYPHCDAWSLSWPYRCTLLMHELKECHADVICLQEVQLDSYETDLVPAMAELGYDGLFKQKTRESMGQHGKVDGCAMFWRRSKFTVKQNYSIEFNECAHRAVSAMKGLDETERHKMISRLCKDNIAQLIVFEVIPRARAPPAAGGRHIHILPPQALPSHVCIVNTHLYSNHTRPEIKLWQTLTLLREIEHFVLQQELALIICGDFNSEPTSAVYQYLSEGGVDRDHPELAAAANANADTHTHPNVLPDAENIFHNIELSSCMMTAMGHEPSFTNYTKAFKGTLDYIWYTPGRLKVLAVTCMPEESMVVEHGEALPNVVYPSDHLMLCADLSLSGAGAGSVNAARHPSHRKNQQQQQILNSMVDFSPQKGSKNPNRR